MQPQTWNDSYSRFCAMFALAGALLLLYIGASGYQPIAHASEPRAVMIIATPRLPVMVVATPTAAPPEPTVAPLPTPEPVIVIEYVPATVAPPPVVFVEAPAGESAAQPPVVEKGTLGGRPNDNDGKGRRPNDAPEAVGP